MRITSVIGAACCFALLCFGVWSSARTGLSRTYSQYAAQELQDNLNAVSAENGVSLQTAITKAIEHDAANPWAYIAAAQASEAGDDTQAAMRFIERAVNLRPEDFGLWVALGRLRDKSGDATAARYAFEQAIIYAPYYAEAHWQLGNVLLREGNQAAAFEELRRAAASDPALAAYTINLAWRSSGRDAATTVELLQPQTDEARLALANFLVAQGNTAEALSLYEQARSVSENAMQGLLTRLFETKNFRLARDLSLKRQGVTLNGMDTISNGGFESELKRGATLFGWRIAGSGGSPQVSVDSSVKSEGKRSVVIRWGGDFGGNNLSQLFIVEPDTRYRLSFIARTQEIVSGGLPLVTVTDAATPTLTLAQSPPLPSGTADWKPYVVDFTTSPTAQAVVVTLAREGCAAPCPIFGRVWLDDFEVQKS
ncbi:MAG: carbohydrate binding domain-containing protein [Pyrinomonadaceae bacterium MAG19_C2-C3]|nr:carbohydrate binding domain-containing protein [Pyrinomonadaceae bacterium MAG19_C2-C3]